MQYYLLRVLQVLLLIYIPGYVLAQQPTNDPVIDSSKVDEEEYINLYEADSVHLDSAHIPFDYDVLFEKQIEYKEIERKIFLKKKNRTFYSFDSLKNFQIVTSKKQFCEDNIVYFAFNNKRYNIIDLYKKYSLDYEDMEYLPIFLGGSYLFSFNHKNYLYLETGYYSNLSIISAQIGCFLFDVTDSSNIALIPIQFPQWHDAPLCFGDIDGNQELDLISFSWFYCGVDVYQLKKNQFILHPRYQLAIECIEINQAPVPAYLYFVDLANSKWPFDLRDRWKNRNK